MKHLKMLFCIFLFFNIYINVKAFSKEDIVKLTDDIQLCSTKTKSLVRGAKATYTRILNERYYTPSQLDSIYNNIKKVIDILNKNNICSIDDKDKIPKDIKNKLYELYKKTNEIILNAPKITNNNIPSSSIVIDSSTNQVKLYEDGNLADIIELEERLNYVGLNKTLILLIVIFIVSLLILLCIRKKTKIKISLIYVITLLLLISLIFRNPISIILDNISLITINNKQGNKEIVVENEKIISYPLYGNKYAKLYIGNDFEDIYFGDSSDILKKGIGQKSSSLLPGEGSRTILSGHNTKLLSKLSSLTKGNNITIETIYAKFIYEIMDIQVVNDDDTSILESNYDLIIYTCYPNVNIYTNKRIVVFADVKTSKWIGDVNENN